MKPNVIIYRESFLQSVWSDTYTFGCYFFVLAGNHFLLKDNMFTYFFLMFMFLLAMFTRAASHKNVFLAKDDAIEYIKNL